jgi:hypothetical protein
MRKLRRDRIFVILTDCCKALRYQALPLPGRVLCGKAKHGSIAPQVEHSRQRMQPETLTALSTFTPIEQRLRQRLHSMHCCGLNRR